MRLKRSQRKYLVKAELSLHGEKFGNANCGMTSYQLARAQNLVPSQWFRKLLYEMEAEGHIKSVTTIHRAMKDGSFIPAYRYLLPSQQYTKQMDMFGDDE